MVNFKGAQDPKDIILYAAFFKQAIVVCQHFSGQQHKAATGFYTVSFVINFNN